MTKKKARQEAQRIDEAQRRFAAAQAEAAVRNSEAAARGTYAVQRPIFDVRPMRTTATLPGGQQVAIEVFHVKVGAEEQVFETKGDATDWGRARMRAWTEAHADDVLKEEAVRKVRWELVRLEMLSISYLSKLNGLPTSAVQEYAEARGALRRFLAAAEGRPIDDINAEIAAAVQQRVYGVADDR